MNNWKLFCGKRERKRSRKDVNGIKINENMSVFPREDQYSSPLSETYWMVGLLEWKLHLLPVVFGLIFGILEALFLYVFVIFCCKMEWLGNIYGAA